MDITRPTVTNYTRLKTIVRKFVPSKFDGNSRDFCWQSHLSLSPLPRVHELIASYSHYEMTVTDVFRKIERATNSLNPVNTTCLPSTHIIGFPRCGSTYLYQLLSKHPDMRHAREKEPHFWTKFPLENQIYDTYSFLTYLANFVGDNLSTDTRKKVSVMDASASTIWYTQRLDDLCAVPKFLKHLTPKAKFIVLMRNPVDQLYSDFWHFTLNCDASVLEKVKRDVMKKAFYSLIKREMKRLEECMVDDGIGKCIHNNLLIAGSALRGCKKIRLGISIYVVFIKRWLKFFNSEQFLFIRLEDLIDSPYQVLIKVWNFLDVRVLKEEEFEKIISSTSRVLSNYPEISRKTRTALGKFYAPFNAELATLLNDTTFLWN